MRAKTKNKLLNMAFDFNIFCVGVALIIVGVHWCNQIAGEDTISQGILRVIEVVVPNLLEFLSGGNALQPTDFVNNKTN